MPSHAATHTLKLADCITKQLPEMTNADAITALRQKVEKLGGYDKDLVTKSMIAAISNEHPLGATKTH